MWLLFGTKIRDEADKDIDDGTATLVEPVDARRTTAPTDLLLSMIRSTICSWLFVLLYVDTFFINFKTNLFEYRCYFRVVIADLIGRI